MTDRIEAGVQLHLPTYIDLSLAELTGIAKAADGEGFAQVWVTDNMECRNTFVVLAAFASVIEAKLGTAIMAQYFRSPVEAARSLVTVSELMGGGRELCVGVGTGNPTTSRAISMPRPVGFMRQTVTSLRQLLDGEEIEIDDYPLMREYFNFAEGAGLRVAGQPGGPVRVYGGGNGPKGLAMAGELMDGLIFGWTTKLNHTLGRIAEKLDIVADSRARHGRDDAAVPFKKVTELKISIAEDHEAARAFVREDPSCARRTLGLRRRGYTDDDLVALGIEPADVDVLERVWNEGGNFADFSAHVTDGMIDASYIAGRPEFCARQIQEFAGLVRDHGFEQVIFSELGPDPVAALALINRHVMPALNEPVTIGNRE